MKDYAPHERRGWPHRPWRMTWVLVALVAAMAYHAINDATCVLAYDKVCREVSE